MKITLNYEVSGPRSNWSADSIILTTKPANNGEYDQYSMEAAAVYSTLGKAKAAVRKAIREEKLNADDRSSRLYWLREMDDEQLLDEYFQYYAGYKGELLETVREIDADHPIAVTFHSYKPIKHACDNYDEWIEVVNRNSLTVVNIVNEGEGYSFKMAVSKPEFSKVDIIRGVFCDGVGAFIPPRDSITYQEVKKALGLK